MRMVFVAKKTDAATGTAMLVSRLEQALWRCFKLFQGILDYLQVRAGVGPRGTLHVVPDVRLF